MLENVGGLRGPVPSGDPFPPGRPVPTHIIPFDISDKTPTEGEIEAAVRLMRIKRKVINTHL